MYIFYITLKTIFHVLIIYTYKLNSFKTQHLFKKERKLNYMIRESNEFCKQNKIKG